MINKVLIPKENESYDQYIYRILTSRLNKKDENEYQEKHHIKPRCLGGTNDSDNLVYLYAQEHYYAHKMLAIENPDEKGLQYAWLMMSCCFQNGKRKYKISVDDYEKARTICSDMLSGENNPMYGKTRENSPLYGKHPSEETRKKMSENHADYSGENNPNYGKHFSEEIRKQMSENMTGRYIGENNPFYGKNHTNESKTKISESRKGKYIGENSGVSRAVYCPELDEFFWGATEVERKYGINHSSIARCCRGKCKYAGKHPITNEELHWQYVSNINNINEITKQND